MLNPAGGERWETTEQREVRLRDAELQAAQVRRAYIITGGARRAALPVVLWRWRYEVGLALAVPAVLTSLLSIMGFWWTVADITLLAMFFALWAPARAFVVSRTWCVITAHRVRTGCAEAYLVSRSGALPFIYSTTPAPSGERVKLCLPAGLSVDDFASATHILAAACWAAQVRVTAHPVHSNLILLEVIRRPASNDPPRTTYDGDPPETTYDSAA